MTVRISPSDFGQTGKLLGDANRRDIRLSNPLESPVVSGAGSGSHGTAPNVTSGEAGPSNEVGGRCSSKTLRCSQPTYPSAR